MFTFYNVNPHIVGVGILQYHSIIVILNNIYEDASSKVNLFCPKRMSRVSFYEIRLSEIFKASEATASAFCADSAFGSKLAHPRPVRYSYRYSLGRRLLEKDTRCNQLTMKGAIVLFSA